MAQMDEMVAQMDVASMIYVVQGPNKRSRGLIVCSFFGKNRYDYKRHHIRGPGPMMTIWDFVLWREDDTMVALHPNFSNTKIACEEQHRIRGTLRCPALDWVGQIDLGQPSFAHQIANFDQLASS